jgi:hypothetical protein
MSDKPIELGAGNYIVRSPEVFVRLIKILRSGSMVFCVEKATPELSKESELGTMPDDGSADLK